MVSALVLEAGWYVSCDLIVSGSVGMPSLRPSHVTGAILFACKRKGRVARQSAATFHDRCCCLCFWVPGTLPPLGEAEAC